MRALDLELRVGLRLLSHISDAEAADVIVTTSRNQDSVEIAEADWTVVLEDFALDRVTRRISISNVDVFLVDVSLDANLVALSDFGILNCLVDTAPFFTILIFLVNHSTIA